MARAHRKRSREVSVMKSHMKRIACAAALLLPLLAPAAPRTGMLETAPGVSVYFEKHGDGPQVTLIPGRLFLARDFARLARKDRTLIFYDMRNRGASSHVTDGAKLTILEDVNDLEALRRHFKAEKVNLVGYSYLGLMTALYVSAHPDRVNRLVQIGPVPREFPGNYPPEERADDRTLPEEARAARVAADQAHASGKASQRDLCRLEHRYWSYLLVGNPANATRNADNCQYENEWPDNFQQHLGHHFGDIQKRKFPAAQFEKLELPVLVIHGRLDVNAPYGSGREWARTFPDARLITVDNAAHNLWLDDPDAVTDIGRFLDGEWPLRAKIAR
jgi:pimeloyl-ACP methyl ester carboxylesterase